MDREIKEIAARADAMYHDRTDTAQVRESVELLRSTNRPLSYELQWRLSRAHFFLGQEAADDPAKLRQHRAGSVAGRKAVRADAKRVEAQFWLGVNLALEAALVTPWRAVALALHAKRTLRRAIELDPAYHGAGPHRVLARLLSHMPGMTGGGVDRARRHFNAAVELDPANTVTRIYFAEFLRGLGQPEQARAQLQAVIVAPADEYWSFEQERDRALAVKLLAAEVN